MFAMPSFFALIVQPSARLNISCAISSGDLSAYPVSRVLMNHAFSAKRHASMKKRHAVRAADASMRAGCSHAHRLATFRVVGDGDHRERDVACVLAQHALERGDVHVSLEGMNGLRLVPLAYRQVESDCAAGLDVRSRRVEMRVVGNDRARLAHRARENVLGRATLVRRDHMIESGDLLH